MDQIKIGKFILNCRKENQEAVFFKNGQALDLFEAGKYTLKTDNIHDETYKSNTAYGVLIEGYGTCNGYSDAMAIFLNKMNIINYKIKKNLVKKKICLFDSLFLQSYSECHNHTLHILTS